MSKKAKLIYIIGAAAIGVLTVLTALFALISVGVIDGRQKTVLFSSGSATFTYDGKGHVSSEWEIKDGELKEGHTAKVTVTGIQTDVGQSVNNIAAVILDSNGADVTSDYVVQYAPGTITVIKRAITIKTFDKSKVYDGTPLTCKEYEISQGELAENQIVDCNVSGSIVGVGTKENSVSAIVRDADGNDKTDNYEISYVLGSLSVTERPITIVSGSKSKIYDGTPLTCEDYEIKSGEVISIHTIEYKSVSSVTDAGETENRAIAKIVDGDGVDVSGNYSVEIVCGKLSVEKRRLSVVSADATKTYDGKPLIKEECRVSDDTPLVDGETLSSDRYSSVTDAGVYENKFSVAVTDGNGLVKTADYEIEFTYGTLKIIPLTITVTTLTKHRSYNGQPLTSDDYSFKSDNKILDIHDYTVQKTGEITDVGSVENTAKIEVTEKSTGRDVSANYEFDYMFGDLIVTPRALAVQSKNAEKYYDGTELTCEEWEIVSGTPPVEGHTVSVKVVGKRLSVGQDPNTIAEVSVTDENGNDVTFNYEVTKIPGVLAVKDNSGSGSGSGSESGSGGAGATGNFSKPDNSNPQPVLIVKSDCSGKLYFRYESAGNYTGNGWTAANEFTDRIDGYSLNYLPSLLCYGKINAQNASIKNLGNEYVLPYFAILGGGTCASQTSDVRYRGEAPSDYTVSYFPYEKVSAKLSSLNAASGSYAAIEARYRKFVYANYLQIPDSTKVFLSKIIAEQGFRKDDANIIDKVASYIQTSAEYNLDFNEELNRQKDVVVAFLADYKEGICQHYASAGTMMFRALGIPARYVGGYVSDVEKEKEKTITTKQAHAWVEVYLDGIGWFPVEVTGGGPGGGSGGSGGSGGEEDADKPLTKLTVTPVTTYVKYNGLTVKPVNDVRGLTSFLQKNSGYRYEVEVSGEYRNVGIYETSISSFKLFDADGNDVTEKYDIKLNTGTLQIYCGEITISTGSLSQVYNGQALKSEDLPKVSGDLMYGHRFEILKTTISRKNVGTSRNVATIKIVDADGNDVTYMYFINKDFGTLTVTPREITITARSVKRAYDGTKLTCNEYEIDGEIVDGETLEVTISGEQQKVGSCSNVVTSVSIKDKSGKSVSKNYVIKCVDGTLTVTK